MPLFYQQKKKKTWHTDNASILLSVYSQDSGSEVHAR